MLVYFVIANGENIGGWRSAEDAHAAIERCRIVDRALGLTYPYEIVQRRISKYVNGAAYISPDAA